VVSYGLNDTCSYDVGEYANALENIFTALKEKGVETVFLTQNCMCTKTSPHLKDELFKNLSVNFADIQNQGKLKSYMDKACEISSRFGIKVCNLYPVWEKLISYGVDVTELLSNKLNHPIREIHYYMAIKLLETIFDL
jgi:hypothetical protein